ncbi:MAG: pili assembly chaperone [Acidobacteria bacterium]|nr:pili assembly chaperone [Acidobacteriota bacterium]
MENVETSRIELLIGLALLAIVCSIGFVNMRAARISANENAAIAVVGQINRAQAAYIRMYPQAGFTTLAALGGTVPCTPSPSTACILDQATSSGRKNGYAFNVTIATPKEMYAYAAHAAPLQCGLTGVRTFFSDQSRLIRYKQTDECEAADRKSPPLP